MLLITGQTIAQKNFDLELRVGGVFTLNQGLTSWPYKFPGFKLFVSVLLEQDFHDHWGVKSGNTLTMYKNSLGNDLNPTRADYQFDLMTSLTVSHGWEPSDTIVKYLRTVNSSQSYNIKHNYKYFGGISSIFIINSSKRHQILGAITGTIDQYSFNYYNDGGFPINVLPIADNFDRWWTGGVQLFVHNKEGNYNSMEFSFDQFTGYSPLKYELASLLGLRVSDYNSDIGTNESTSFNSSAYNIRLSLSEDKAINFGVNGNLSTTSKNGTVRYWGLQDMIHIARKIALHPNYDLNKFHIGFDYSTSTLTHEF